MASTIFDSFSSAIYQPRHRSLTRPTHVSGAGTLAAQPPRFLLEVQVTKWEQRAQKILSQYKKYLNSIYLPEPEEGALFETEGDAVAQLGLYLCHPVQMALRRACPAMIHGSEVTSRSTSVTLPRQVPLSRADKAYMYLASSQGRPTPFAVLELKKASSINAEEFRDAMISDKATFIDSMQDTSVEKFTSRPNARTLLKQATNYSMAFDTPFVAIADMRTLVLLVFSRRDGTEAGDFALVTVVEDPRIMRKALLGFLLMAYQNRATPGRIERQVLSNELRDWLNGYDSWVAGRRGSPAAGRGERHSGRIADQMADQIAGLGM
ncbi:hypothetical protein HDV63DRAFT_265234 [Trichoderma sp. SZMC 28014]